MNTNIFLLKRSPCQKGRGVYLQQKKRLEAKSTDVILMFPKKRKKVTVAKSYRDNINILPKWKKKRNTKNLSFLCQSKKYQINSISDFSTRLQRTICKELYKGKFFSPKNCDESYGIKKRLLRRIVEKRILQYIHSVAGGSRGLFAKHISHQNMRNTINHIVHDYVF